MSVAADDFIQEHFPRFQQEGFAALESLFADDCVWHACGRRIPEPLEGRDAIMGWFANKHPVPDFTIQMHDTFTSDDHVVVLYEEQVERDGRSATFQGVYVMHMTDGKISEVWNIPVDQYAYDDFYVGEVGI